jgi:hypothetical protein
VPHRNPLVRGQFRVQRKWHHDRYGAGRPATA